MSTTHTRVAEGLTLLSFSSAGHYWEAANTKDPENPARTKAGYLAYGWGIVMPSVGCVYTPSKRLGMGASFWMPIWRLRQVPG